MGPDNGYHIRDSSYYPCYSGYHLCDSGYSPHNSNYPATFNDISDLALYLSGGKLLQRT